MWFQIFGFVLAATIHLHCRDLRREGATGINWGCVDDVSRQFPAAHIVIADDLNQLPCNELIELTGLTQIVN